jgi:hypothetical protein
MYIKIPNPKKSIPGDLNLFMLIVNDMKKNAGQLAPAENWGLDIGGHDGGEYFKGNIKALPKSDIVDLFNTKYATMEMMLDPWIGCVGMQKITNESVLQYSQFIRNIDSLNIFKEYVDDKNLILDSGFHLLNTDLGSIIDVNIINKFFNNKLPMNVIEVGGGYGRLAESFFEVFSERKVHYLLLDSVPATLMYAFKYLKSKYPNKKIGFYYNNDRYSFEYDIYIMPSWQFTQTSNKYNICINIQSMQEMSQYHVDYYLRLFDSNVSSDGIIYLSNEKDYVFRGSWNYPKRWKKVLKTRTPRSWTRDSPTEVFTLAPTDEQYSIGIELAYMTQLSMTDINHELENKPFQAIDKNSPTNSKVSTRFKKSIMGKIYNFIRRISEYGK